MMYILVYYLIFCAATSITFQLICLNPVHKVIAKEFPEDICNTSKKMTLAITFIGGMLCAPLFFALLVSNRLCEGFKIRYYNKLVEDAKNEIN